MAFKGRFPEKCFWYLLVMFFSTFQINRNPYSGEFTDTTSKQINQTIHNVNSEWAWCELLWNSCFNHITGNVAIKLILKRKRKR